MRPLVQYGHIKLIAAFVHAVLGLSATCLNAASAEEILEFQEKDRYFPKIIVQYTTPAFMWDDFFSYRMDVWGDNQNGTIEIEKVSRGRPGHGESGVLQDGKLLLREKQMVWLLKRLSYGQLELRWSGLGNPGKGTNKYVGFGDPNEGFAAGFWLHDLEDGKGNQLYATTINYGQTVRTRIPWKKEYGSSTRFFVVWRPHKIEYITITADRFEKVASHTDKDLPGVGLPGVRMEISIQNFSGSSPISVDLVKYDAFGSAAR